MKDFFISYRGADKNWAEWIAWQLEESGYWVDIQAWDFRPGHDFIAEMNRASNEAHRTIAVLTPAYFESQFTESEWTTAFKKGNLLPVRVVDFAVEGLLSARVHIDLAGKNETEAKEALLNGVRDKRRKPTTEPPFPQSSIGERMIVEQPRFPRALPPIWNIPHQQNPNFIGRDSLLDQIHRTLTSENAAALTAIHGLGGVGKTQLASEYAYAHAHEYETVWWIRSEEPATLAGDYALLADRLDLPKKHEREQPVIVDAVRDWLNHHSSWLLIFDNATRAEDLRDYLPQSRRGHVLITSRDPNWGRVARSLEVELLDRADAVRFVLQRTGQDDEASARALATELGDLPLALEQAGAYIETRMKPLAEYLRLFQSRNTELLRRGKPADYPATVATTWEISFQQAQKESPAAGGLLNLCAFMAPDDIPLDMLRDAADHLPEVLARVVADEIAFDDIIAGLRRYSLVERTGDSLKIHRLVQKVARDRLEEAARIEFAKSAVSIVSDVFPNESDDVRVWPTCARLLPHALSATEYAEGLNCAPQPTARLLNLVGLYSRGQAQYDEARIAFERALRIDEGAFDSDHPDLARDLSNLGSVLQDVGDLVVARECFERALRIDEEVFDLDHPDVARDVNNLGSLLQDIGDLLGARECFERALRIDETIFGAEHPTVAIHVNNIGLVLKDIGELASARLCFERALRIDEAAFGFDHPKVAVVVNNLGLVLEELDDLPNARMCFERALRIDTAAFGPDHPEVATDVNNLGGVLRDLGDLRGARQCYERALRIDEVAFGRDHPNVSISINNLGLVLKDLGDLGGARRCFEHALRIDESALGAGHPELATDVNNLGLVLGDLGDLAGARKSFERALRIDEAVFGPDHSSVARDVNNLGLVLKELGDLGVARLCFERALRIDEEMFGPDHSSVARDLNNLGLVLEDLGDLADARLCYERALRIDEKALGSDHPEVAIDVNNLGSALQDLGDLAGARHCYERALRIDEGTFGAHHPSVARDVNNLGSLLRDLGDLAGAQQFYQRALKIWLDSLGPDHSSTLSVRNKLESLKREMSRS